MIEFTDFTWDGHLFILFFTLYSHCVFFLQSTHWSSSLWPSVGGPSTMVSQSSPLDDPAAFRALMIECHMPSIQIEHIVTSGYTTIALLAHGVHDESKMEEFVEYLSLIPAGETFVTFSPQSASIRRVLKECIARCIQSGRDGCESPPSGFLSELSWGAVDATIYAITFLSEHTERSH